MEITREHYDQALIDCRIRTLINLKGEIAFRSGLSYPELIDEVINEELEKVIYDN